MKWLFYWLVPFGLFAQVPNGMNLQAIVRDVSGKPVALQNVSMRVAILQGGTGGAVVFGEEHRASTNVFGLVNVLMGYGFPVTGKLDQIDWTKGPYYLKIEIDPSGGSSYELNSVSPLLSVPFAFYAEKTNLKAGPGILLKNNTIQAIDSSSDNEIQQLSLNERILNLSNGGGTVILPSGADQWGSQVVITGSGLKGDGTPAVPLDVADDAIQSNHILNGSIKNEDLYPGLIPNYTSGAGILLRNDTIYNSGDLSNINELQQLTYDPTSRTLSISQGNGIVFAAGTTSRISDNDGNTYVDVEKNANEDKVRFGIDGKENWVMTINANGSPRLQAEGPGSNLFIGNEAGLNNDGNLFPKGFGNAFLGAFSGVGNTSGSRNVGVGTYALWGNASGDENAAFGFESLLLGDQGKSNTALGFRAMMNYIRGSYNVAIGSQTLMITDGGNNNIAIGAYAQALSKNRNGIIAIGDSTLFFNGSGVSDLNKSTDNLAIGSKAMYSNTEGAGNVAIGNQSMYYNEKGDRNTSVGVASMFNNAVGHSNTGIGYHALFANENGNSNVAIGTNAMSANLGGEGNVAIGSTTMFGNADGNMNTAVGNGAMFSNSSGVFNVAVGSSALSNNTTGIHNVAMGSDALLNNGQGINNTVVGTFAGYNNNAGYDVTAVGFQAGSQGTQNQYCTYLGSLATNNGNINLQNSTAIGANARVNASNQVRIGDANTLSIGGYKSWTNISDGRYKMNVQQDVKGLDFIMRLRPISYQLNTQLLKEFLGETTLLLKHEDGISQQPSVYRQSGFIAQDVETAANLSAYDFSGVDKPKNENDLYGLRYAEFVVPLVKAVQEQQVLIESQKEQLLILENKLNALQREMHLLKNKQQ